MTSLLSLFPSPSSDRSPARTPILLVSLLVAGTFSSCSLKTHSDVEESIFGGPDARDVVETATQVVAHRIDPTDINYGRPAADYPQVGDPVPLDATQREAIQRLLLSPDSYGWDYAKGCLPTPGVRLVFTAPGGEAQVLLCYECLILAVDHGGKIVGGEDFDPIESELVALAKALFPDDEAIQDL